MKNGFLTEFYCNLHAAQKGIQCHNIKESSLLQCKCLIKAQISIKIHLWSVNFLKKTGENDHTLCQ